MAAGPAAEHLLYSSGSFINTFSPLAASPTLFPVMGRGVPMTGADVGSLPPPPCLLSVRLLAGSSGLGWHGSWAVPLLGANGLLAGAMWGRGHVWLLTQRISLGLFM